MCLQWCHVRSWLIDNDLPCTGCDRSEPDLLPAAWSCASCMHLIAHDGQAGICGLTRETLPLAGRCCHWQAERISSMRLLIGDEDIAPWLNGAAVAIFDASPSAPPITFDAGRVVVDLDALSVPLVYGVPAFAWDAALGWELPMPVDLGTPFHDVRQRAITDALAALEQGAPALEQSLGELAEALGPDGIVALPEGWLDILTELIALGRDFYGAHARISTQLDKLETRVCISH